MANNNNGNGKEKIEIALDKKTNQRLESYAEEREQSVQSVKGEYLKPLEQGTTCEVNFLNATPATLRILWFKSA